MVQAISQVYLACHVENTFANVSLDTLKFISVTFAPAATKSVCTTYLSRTYDCKQSKGFEVCFFQVE